MESEDILVTWACCIAFVAALVLIWLEPEHPKQTPKTNTVVSKPLKA